MDLCEIIDQTKVLRCVVEVCFARWIRNTLSCDCSVSLLRFANEE